MKYGSTYLYKLFAPYCLREREYAALEDCGAIGSGIGTMFSGPIVVSDKDRGDDMLARMFAGNVGSGRALAYGEKLFLEAWHGTASENRSYERLGRLNILFYDDFAVMSMEPDIDVHNRRFATPTGVLPVAVPLQYFKRARAVESSNVVPGAVDIALSAGPSSMALRCYIFGAGMKPVNWSFNANNALLGGCLTDGTSREDALAAVVSRIESLIANSTDFKARRLSLARLLNDEKACNIILDSAYLPDRQYVEHLARSSSEYQIFSNNRLMGMLRSADRLIRDRARVSVALLRESEEKAELISMANKQLRESKIRERGKIRKRLAELSESKKNIDGRMEANIVPDSIYRQVLDFMDGARFHEKYAHSVDVYIACAERGLSKIQTQEERLEFNTACRQEGIPYEYRNADCFYDGKKLLESTGLPENLWLRAACTERINMETAFCDNRKKADMDGDAKYAGVDGRKTPVDVGDETEWFGYLECEVIRAGYHRGGTLDLDISVSIAADVRIGDAPVIIDGSLKVLVCKDGEAVGEAFVCAPGFGGKTLSRVGFNARDRYHAIAIPYTGCFERGTEYSFEFLPHRLWIMAGDESENIKREFGPSFEKVPDDDIRAYRHLVSSGRPMSAGEISAATGVKLISKALARLIKDGRVRMVDSGEAVAYAAVTKSSKRKAREAATIRAMRNIIAYLRKQDRPVKEGSMAVFLDMEDCEEEVFSAISLLKGNGLVERMVLNDRNCIMLTVRADNDPSFVNETMEKLMQWIQKADDEGLLATVGKDNPDEDHMREIMEVLLKSDYPLLVSEIRKNSARLREMRVAHTMALVRELRFRGKVEELYNRDDSLTYFRAAEPLALQ